MLLLLEEGVGANLCGGTNTRLGIAASGSAGGKIYNSIFSHFRAVGIILTLQDQ